MLALDNLSIGYDGKAIVSGVTLSLAPGTMACLLGNNGTGKSTLLKTVAGFLKPVTGTVTYGGRPLERMSPKERATTVGVVLTGRAESQLLTVEDLVGLGLSPYTGFFGRLSAGDRQIVDACMEMIDIASLRRKRLSELSDGEYQKAIIAKALAQQTPVILMDEPTAYLDFRSKVELLELSSQLAHSEGKTVLVTTHDVNLALKIADTVLLMQEGRVLVNPDSDDIRHFIGTNAAGYL
jgi:iron complex transport system ATP-binding protein